MGGLEGRGGYGGGLDTKGNSETWPLRAFEADGGSTGGHKDLGRSQRKQRSKKTGEIWTYKQRKCFGDFRPPVVTGKTT